MTTTSRLRPAERRAGPALGAGETDPSGPARRRVLLGAAAALLLGALVVWVVAFSSLLGVRHVDVRGESTLTAAQIRSAAGIADGTPLVRLDTAGAAGRIERLPAVASARVSTSLPSTVVITVIERVAVGFVSSGDAFVLVDRTGVQYRTVPTRPGGLPLFVLPAGAAARATGAAVGTVAAALPATIRAQVQSIQALDTGSISLVLRDGVLVQWGGAARSADKAQILPALLKTRPAQVDVTNPDQPFTR